MKLSKISVVTVCLNHAKYLEATINSVLDQGYPNLEYIIIDGGSTDGSVEIIKKYANQLAYWVSEKDKGMYDAINKGFAKSTGEIMAWINADDIYHPIAFKTVSQIFETFQDVSWFQGIPSTVNSDGNIVAVRPLRRWSKYNIYLGDYAWIQQESTFWRRSLWDKAGGQLNVDLKYASDFELWLRFFEYEKLFVANVLIGAFRISGSKQISVANRSKYEKEVEQAIKKQQFDATTAKRLAEIKKVKSLLDKTAKLNIGRLKMKYWRLFDYPPQLIYNFSLNKFEQNLAEGFVYQ